MSSHSLEVFTIGHSTHPLTEFVRLLKMPGITVLADIRSAPYSRFRPDYNKERLQKSLGKEGIGYVFLGQELGARSNDPTCYENGRIQYHKLAQTALFKRGLERLLSGARSQRIALLCAEGEPLACHRSLLVGRELENLGASVVHIHSDGKKELHSEAMARLMRMCGLDKPDMFRTYQESLDKACALQEQRIAYVAGSNKAERVDIA